MTRVVFPESERGRESYVVVFHRGEERIVPRAGVGRGVGDDVDAAADGSEDVGGVVRMDEDGFVGAMRFVDGALDGGFGERGAALGGGEKFDGVDAAVEEIFCGVGGLRGVGDFGRGKFHEAHDAEDLVGGKSARRDETGAGGADFGAWDFAGADAIAKVAGVFPGGASVEDAGEAEAREHVLELAGEFGRGDGGGVGPFALEKMDVIVPEAGGDREAEAIEDMRSFGELHLRARADGDDFFILDEDDAVADGRVGGANVDGGADERGIIAWGDR